ncbi:MAG: MaoC family dehydratase N-terminal domain-containing protein [Myxococcales bacterium]|nr:MaoC family dehydratase N-terminal domain-containing protein [Myxococcales bacterium]
MSEAASETLVTEDMMERKGVWANQRTSPPVSESDIRKWAIATYWPETPPRVYWDADYASTTKHRGIIAPPDFNPFAWPVHRPRRGAGAARGAAGSARTVDGKPVRRTTGMNGGQTDTYGVPMRPGDVIRSRSRLVRWEERQGRLGLTLYTYTETEWTNQDGALVRRRISTGIRY